MIINVCPSLCLFFSNKLKSAWKGGKELLGLNGISDIDI